MNHLLIQMAQRAAGGSSDPSQSNGGQGNDLARGLVGQKISYLLRGGAIIAKDLGTKFPTFFLSCCRARSKALTVI